jgi:hypothetical protein
MKYLVFLTTALLLCSATASAEEEVGTVTESATAAEPAPEPSKEEKKRSPYYRKARGWLWIEVLAGPSSYDPDSFGSLGSVQNAPKLKGPEYGFAVGTPFGGPFFLGFFYRQANYGQYKLLKTGLDMQGSIMIPYVHIILRGSIGFAQTFQGNPYDLTNADNGGVSFTGGFGLRIPIIRWISFATTFDWTYIALSMRGDNPSDGSRIQSWINGQQFGATFALTFQFIGVRKD